MLFYIFHHFITVIVVALLSLDYTDVSRRLLSCIPSCCALFLFHVCFRCFSKLMPNSTDINALSRNMGRFEVEY